MTLSYIFGQETLLLPEFTPEKIRALREALGESQTEFGERFGYTQKHMSNIENGRTPIMPVFDLALQTVAREVSKKGRDSLRTLPESTAGA